MKSAPISRAMGQAFRTLAVLFCIPVSQMFASAPVNLGISAAESLLDQNKPQQAIEVLRKILSSKVSETDEQRATFLLGQAMLKSRQPDLAREAFAHLAEHFPNHPYKTLAEFSMLEYEMSGLTNASDFIERMRIIKTFAPFSLDFDFFRYASGFSKGMNLNLYTPVYQKLKIWFTSEDPELKGRALLLDGLIRLMDLGDARGAESLSKVLALDGGKTRSVAEFALFLHACRNSLHDLTALESSLPRFGIQNEESFLPQLLWLQILAWIHGDFEKALALAQRLSEAPNKSLADAVRPHQTLLQKILRPNPTMEQRFQLALELKAFGSFFFALEELRSLIKDLRPNSSLARAHYEAARILQDDLNDREGAEFHLKAAQTLPLPPELKDEIEWRRIRNLSPKEQAREMERLSGLDLSFSEAAIFRQLKHKTLNPRLVDKYYKTLDRVELDPASRREVLIHLAELSENSHQYPRARFYLELLARLDLSEAKKRLKTNLLSQKIYEARLQQTLAVEPEKQVYLQGKYLLQLGRVDEGKKLLESIQSRRSVYAEKSRFELFVSDIGPMPYEAKVVRGLLDFLNQSPDPEVQALAYLRWLRHQEMTKVQPSETSSSQASAATTPSTSRPDQNDFEQTVMQGLQITHSFPEHFAQALPLAHTLLLNQSGPEQAAKALQEYISKAGQPLRLKLELEQAIVSQDAQTAAALCLQLAKEEPAKREYWLERAVRQHLQRPKDPEFIDRYLTTMESFAKDHGDEFFAILRASLLVLGGIVPERQELRQILLKYEDSLLESSKEELLSLLEGVLKHAKGNEQKSLLLMRLKHARNYATLADQHWLFPLIQKSFDDFGPRALLAIGLACQRAGRSLTELPDYGYLSQLVADMGLNVQGIDKSDSLDYLNILYGLLPEVKQQELQGSTNKDPVVSRFLMAKAALSELGQDKWNSAASKINTLVADSTCEIMLKMELIKAAFEKLNPHREKKISEFRSWLFKIKPDDLPLPERDVLMDIMRKVNAESVVAALRRDINWDDPQSASNIRIFLQIADLFLKDLKDIPSAINVLQQMKEYFSDSSTRNEIKSREKDILTLNEVYRLLGSGVLADSIRASELLMIQLQRPQEAMQALERAARLAKSVAESDMVHMHRARVYLLMREPAKAEKEMELLSQAYDQISLSLLQQIEATRQLAELPPRNTATEPQLLEHARIHLLTWFDIREAEIVYSVLERRFPKALGPVADARALLCLDFYNALMGVNEPSKATAWLRRGVSLASTSDTKARLAYMLGYHAYTYDLNTTLATSAFLDAKGLAPGSEWAQLALLHLIELYENSQKNAEALALLEELKSSMRHERPAQELQPRQDQLRKSILLARLDEFLQKLGPEDKQLILRSARSMAQNPDYLGEAENKYLLYLRLESDPTNAAAIRLELGNFFLQSQQMQKALKAYKEVFEAPIEHGLRFQGAMLAINILGDRMQNYQGAIALGREARRLLVPPQDIQRLDLEINRFKQEQARQKPTTLKTLGYGHLEPIQAIKQDFYRKRDYVAAAEAYEKLLKQTENFQLQVGIHYELARLYDLRLKRYDLALEHYQKFFNLVDSPEVGAEVLLRIAELQFTEFRNHREALKSYRSFVQKFPASKKYVSVLFQIAEILVGKELDYSGALDVYTDIANAYPQTDFEQRALLARAQVQSERLSDFNGAIATYQSIINNYFDSDFATKSQYEIGRIYEVQLNDEGQAIAAYQEVISRWPNSTLANDARRQIDKIRRR